VVFALEKRQKAQLDLGDGAGALDTYRTMKEVAPDHPKTAVAGLNVAKSRREPAEKAFDRFRGKLDPEDLIVWDEMLERPGAREAWKDLHEAYLLYREWLLGSESGGDKYDNWKMIAFYFYNIGAWDEACDLYRQAVERFKGTSKLTPDDLLYLESKLVTALLSKAQREVAAGNLEGAQELWHEAGRFVDDLMNPDSKFSKYPATWRQAAQVYGGFLQRVPGGFRFVPTTGEYDKALVIWKDIESHLTKAGKEGTPEWWEARFYTYLTVYESRRASGSSLTPVREGLNQLKLIRPNLGGEQWKRRFDWLEQKLGM
jgi:tetratricopeptide (TPR) repeat protein